MTGSNCIFCKIVSGEVPCYKINETPSSISFLDIYPHSPGHSVVIPKIHVENIEQSTPDVLTKILFDVQLTILIINKVLRPQGYNVGWNNGEAAGQAIAHLHFHIIPRYNNDGGGSFHSIIKNPGPRPVSEIAELFSYSSLS